MNIFFSASTLWFYDFGAKEQYEEGVGWPVDAVEISDEEWKKYTQTAPENYRLGSDSSGKPAWVLIPPPTHEEQVAAADTDKQARIDQANEYMNSKQWPGKAAIGRLKAVELVQYNLWLDYLDALEAIDTSTAPDITWPEMPA